jgi:mRNA interferase HicA
MKRRDLERRLTESGWRFLRHGGQHDVWTDGEREEAIPRHREINERLARAILRRTMTNNDEI